MDPDQPVDPTKDKRLDVELLRHQREPGRRIGLGHLECVPRRRRSCCARGEPADDDAGGDLRGAVGTGPGRRLHAARHGRRRQRRVLDGDGERAPRQLRSAQVQGPAERSEGDGTALPRGLGVLPGARSELQGQPRIGRRRLQLLRVGRQVRHLRPRKEHPDCDRQPVRLAAVPARREVGDGARAVSDGVLRQAG